MSLLIDIEKRLGSFHLQVQLQAQDEVTALSGASGCGKSMTLKCIAGIVTPDRGRIVLNDRVLFDSAAHIDLPPQRRRMGYLFQNYALFPTMTVEKNILCAIPGSKTEKGAALSDAVRRFRLEGLEHHYPAQLSGGQQQRVALARILCAKPEAILLDEPFSALDSYLKWQLELELSDLLAAFRGPILWVSHDRGEVFRSCRQICVLDHGHSQGTLTPEQLLHRPGTESAARLSGCENIVEAHPAGDAVLLPQWGLTLPCGRAVPPDCGKIGIRAHQITPVPPETPGAFPCRVERTIRDAFTVTVLLVPEGSPDHAACLRMELPQSRLEKLQESPRLWAAVQPEDILLLQ